MNNRGTYAEEEVGALDEDIWARVTGTLSNSHIEPRQEARPQQETIPLREAMVHKEVQTECEDKPQQETATEQEDPSPPKRLLNVKFCLRGGKPVKGASAMILWCDKYEQALEASMQALDRYLPTSIKNWKCWLAISDPCNFTSLAELTPDSFASAVEPENLVLFLCADPGTQEFILYNTWPEAVPDRYRSVNLLAVGSSGVGKTALVQRFSRGTFAERTDTTLEYSTESVRRFTNRSGESIQLVVQELPGQESSESISPTDFLGVAGVFLVYDTTKTFNASGNSRWIKIIHHFDEDVPILLVGSKLDETHARKVQSRELERFKANHDIFAMVMISSKTGENIDAAFQSLVAEAYKRIKKASPSSSRGKSGVNAKSLLASVLASLDD